jgi:antitoxin ChpS
MATATLRKVGGSVMLAVPKTILESLDLRAGAQVSIDIQDGRLLVDPKPRPRYSLEELLAGSDYSKPQRAEDREWVDARPAGREII